MTERDSSDKRMARRLEGVTFPVEYAPREKPDAFRRGRAIGVGESGLMLLSEEALEIGAALRIRLYLPKNVFPFSNWRIVAAEAKVVRVEEPGASDGLRRYGTLITQISEGDAASLGDYLHLAHWIKGKIANR